MFLIFTLFHLGSVPIQNVSVATLNKVEKRLKSVAQEILQAWNKRQFKTDLQKKMVKVFGKIHENSDPVNFHQDMLDLLNEFIQSLPPGKVIHTMYYTQHILSCIWYALIYTYGMLAYLCNLSLNCST